MQFSHHPDLRKRFPELVAGVLHARGITPDADVAAQVARFNAIARARLAETGSESQFPEVQAWRRAFAAMGLKPTQYRCASESLLRRFKKEGELPAIHPLIDLCNAVSIAFGIPVAALDVKQVAWPLQVRAARGDEAYQSFQDEMEQPEAGEVSFVDADNRAHARRWTHRQSGLSAVREGTREVLIVAEALHPAAAEDVPRLVEALSGAVKEVWGTAALSAVLTHAEPDFGFGDF
jgi:DNA/RNA-binding domain of Phe-tRNA-synthetase-like protein